MMTTDHLWNVVTSAPRALMPPGRIISQLVKRNCIKPLHHSILLDVLPPFNVFAAQSLKTGVTRMKRQWSFELSVWLLVCIIGLSCEAAWSQQTPPTEDKGLNAPVITSLDLGPEIEGMQGRQLRMRKVTLE